MRGHTFLMSIQFPNDSASAEQVSHMGKCSHSPTFHLIMIRFLIHFTVLILFSSDSQMEIGHKPILKWRFDSTFEFFTIFVESALKGKMRQKIIHYVSCDCTFSLNTTLGSFVHLHNFYPKLFKLSTMIKIILMQHISFKNPAWKNIAF